MSVVAPREPSRSVRPRVDTTRAGSGPVWRQYLRALGPGLVTGASDDDPSGIATYAQVGARFGFGLLWAALITLPLMAAVQEICDRTALATAKSLGELAAERFARRGRIVIAVLLVALIGANALNIAADLAAIGDGMHLLRAGPPWLWALLAGSAIAAMVMSGSFETMARVFKVICVALLAYLGVLFVVKVKWGSVAAHTFVPHITFSADYLMLLVAVLGTTISPYLFFWQSAHRIEELRDEPEGGEDAIALDMRSTPGEKNKVRTSRADVFAGMTFSNVVMFAIIVATAATLGRHGNRDVALGSGGCPCPAPRGGRVVDPALRRRVHRSRVPCRARPGGLRVGRPVGPSREGWGFSRSPRDAPVFYGLVVAGTAGGTVLTLAGISAMKLLVVVALINGLAAAPFLVVVMLISKDRELMGEHRNGRLARTLGWLTVGLMALAAIALLAGGAGL